MKRDKVAKEALGDNVKAVTILSPYIPKWEIAESELVYSSDKFNPIQY